MKKVLLIITFFCLFIGVFFMSPVSYGKEDTVDILAQLKICRDVKGQVDKITDFICINGTDEQIIYQIIIDGKFKKVDTIIEKYLADLEEKKDYYFGPEARENYLVGIEEITRRFSPGGEYWEMAMDVCGLDTIGDAFPPLGGVTSISEASKYFKSDDANDRMSTACSRLAITKIEIYKEVAYNILPLNKHWVRKDSHKKYVQQERSNYDQLLDIIAINIGYIERIWKKWPSKTETVHKG